MTHPGGRDGCRVRRFGARGSIALGLLLVWLGLASRVQAACFQCSGSPECEMQCTAAESEDDQDLFFDLFCSACDGSVSSPSGVCGSGSFTECTLPLEACCLPDGPCLDMTTANCSSAGGASAGPGSTCPQPPNPSCTRCDDMDCPPGTCVGPGDEDAQYFILDTLCGGLCNASSSAGVACGTGPFTDCTTPQGGCTVPNVDCVITAETSCTAVGGTYLGDGTDCTPELCPLVSPTPSSTPTLTPTSTPTLTPTSTPSSTPTATPTRTPSTTASMTPTRTPSATPSSTPPVTATPTVTPVPQGGECTDPAECAPGLFCAQGVCCNGPCDAPGEACNRPGREGECLAEVPAPAPAVSPRGLVLALGALVAIAALALARAAAARHQR